jgi:hypothetical protein
MTRRPLVGEIAGRNRSGNYDDDRAAAASGTSTNITPAVGTTTTCNITNTFNPPAPAISPIPTLNPALLAALGLLVAGAGAWAVRRREIASARRRD